MVKYEYTNCFLGKAVTLSDGKTELTVTLDVGPRIISLRTYLEKQGRMSNNIMYEDVPDVVNKDCSSYYGEGKVWHIYGGHRLWLSPEDITTYYPDSYPVEFQPIDNGGIFTPRKWKRLHWSIYYAYAGETDVYEAKTMKEFAELHDIPFTLGWLNPTHRLILDEKKRLIAEAELAMRLLEPFFHFWNRFFFCFRIRFCSSQGGDVRGDLFQDLGLLLFDLRERLQRFREHVDRVLRALQFVYGFSRVHYFTSWIATSRAPVPHVRSSTKKFSSNMIVPQWTHHAPHGVFFDENGQGIERTRSPRVF